jgi:serine protease Do
MTHFMNEIKQFFIAAAALAILWAPTAATAAEASAKVPMVPASFSQLAEQARPGVVNIQTVKTIKGGGRVFQHFFGSPFGGNQKGLEEFLNPFFQQQPQSRTERSLGSGFIIDKKGYIVTNHHVIKDADQIKVILHDKKEYDAKIIGADPMTDLALIKIEAKHLKPLKFGSSEKAVVGTWVVAIGSPFGLEQTVTAGIISAKGRIIGSGPYDDFIQTDASINPGNSGGPLLNLDGEVIGINTAIVKSGQGIGFAIPSDMATGIIDQLTETSHVSRGWLGVSIQNVSKEMAEYYGLNPGQGVYVAKAFEDNPAYEAGIRQGDVILSIDDKRINSSRDLTITIANLKVGQSINVTLMRGKEEKTFKVKLGERPDKGGQDQVPGQSDFDDFGFMFRQVDDEIANRLGFHPSVKGLVVTQIKPGSLAARSGVRQGDLLTEMNHRKITNSGDYAKVLSKIKKGELAHMLFKRSNGQIFVVRFEKQ